MEWYNQAEDDAGTGYIGTFQSSFRDKTRRGWTWRKLGSVLDSKSFRDAFLEDPDQRVFRLRGTAHSFRPETDWEDTLDSPEPIETYLEGTIERSLVRCVSNSLSSYR